MSFPGTTATTYYPHNCSAEMYVLSALTKDTQLYHTLQLDEKDFYDTRNKMIFFSIRDLSTKFNDLSPADIIDNLKSISEIQKAGGEEHITKICSMTTNDFMLMDRVRSVQDHKVRRNAIVFGLEVAAKASSDSTGEALIGFVNAGLGKVFSDIAEPTEKVGSRVLSSYMQKVADKKAGKTDKILLTGLRPLDAMFDGQLTVSKNYVILGATPSTGKTALIGQIFWNWVKNGHKVFFASQEMSAEEVVNRIVANVSGVSLTHINKMEFYDEREEAHVMKTFEHVTAVLNENAEIYENSKMSVETIQAKAMAFRRKHKGLAAIVVDYMQRIRPPSQPSGKKGMAKHEEIAEVSSAFKDMSKDLNCVVCVLSQLTLKDGEDIPEIDHLRGSKDIGQDADICILLHREENRRETEGCDIINVNIAKGRNIGLGSFKARFHSRFMQFRGMNELEMPTEPISKEEWVKL